MSKDVTISVDAMGGDKGPSVVIPGAVLALERFPCLKFLFFGDEAQVRPLIDKYPSLAARSKLIHTDVAVSMDDKPSEALRHGRRVSSMWLALDAVKDGDARFVISAGNTGALMAMARFNLKMMPGLTRPAIAAIWPTMKGESIVLDVGATIGADAEQLVDFAFMGEGMARALFGIERPSVGLLNIGVEEVKGIEEVKRAHQILRKSKVPMDYYGFVEGNDLGQGTVDVVVAEGFSGNIALKTAEGTAKQIAEYLRSALSRTILAKIGYILARSAFETLKEKMDPKKVNGGVFLGLNGIVIKSHGGTDADGFAAGIALGYEMMSNNLLQKIAGDLELHRGTLEATEDQPRSEVT
ncbi:MAG: phosphate acyltransferase PlsX [Fimbriimonadaceae bacterium]|nr:phosphate acyltransferase PlsX [Alphaproteobacteria bacterium]